MAIGYIIVSYLGAAILFILSLGGLSKQETARRGNVYGVLGMAIAVAATVFGVHCRRPRRIDSGNADRRARSAARSPRASR